jgi:hypothetical protein
MGMLCSLFKGKYKLFQCNQFLQLNIQDGVNEVRRLRATELSPTQDHPPPEQKIKQPEGIPPPETHN